MTALIGVVLVKTVERMSADEYLFTMLHIYPQKSAEAAKQHFAKSDDYGEGQAIVGQWGGKGAVFLDLFGQVEKSAFDALCDNLDPRTGEQLISLRLEEECVGYDFSWSAPKSVSIVHALTGDERILGAFRRSVNETMSKLEAEMQTPVREKEWGDVFRQWHRPPGYDADVRYETANPNRAWVFKEVNGHRTTRNMVWAELVRLTSRPVDGIRYPLLQSRMFCFDASFDQAANQWKAGQFGKIKSDAYYQLAVQKQAGFARQLQELGYGIRRTKDAFEIEGVPQSVIDRFSRTGVIERMARKLGDPVPQKKAALGAATPEAKTREIPYDALLGLWKKQLMPWERHALENLCKV